MIYFGVIENNDDSTHIDGMVLGRVQVRVNGKHTENRNDIEKSNYLPVIDLPWFDVAFGVSSPQISKEFITHNLKNGTIVYIQYLDVDEQYGLVMGVATRIPKEIPNFENGFSDPNGINPSTDSLNKSPFYPYGTGENADIIPIKNGSLVDVEPASPYSPEYTKNHVVKTEKHLIEIDDTDGAERIHIYHNSGTFIEIHPNGDQVMKVIKDNHEITISDLNKNVGGNENTKIGGNLTINVQGSVDITSGGDTNITSGGSATVTATTKATVTGATVDVTGIGIVKITGSQVIIN